MGTLRMRGGLGGQGDLPPVDAGARSTRRNPPLPAATSHAEPSSAMPRYEALRPYLEHGVPLARIAREGRQGRASRPGQTATADRGASSGAAEAERGFDPPQGV